MFPMICAADRYSSDRALASPLTRDPREKRMPRIILVLGLLICTTATAYDHNTAIGQWAVYQKNFLKPDYYYFMNLNSDFSGVLVWNFASEPVAREFSSDSLIKRDGYFEVQLGPTEKAVFSAWKHESGEGRLSGQVFMYKHDGDLFNMFYFPMQSLSKNHEFMQYEAIKKLSYTYR